MKVNQKIRDLRKQFGYSQQLFADKIGLSRSVLSQIEINKLKPSVDLIAKIAKEYNISVSYFFELETVDQINTESSLAQEPPVKYDSTTCVFCKQLLVINNIQKDVIHSLEKTISTQFQLIELLEKKIENIITNTSIPDKSHN